MIESQFFFPEIDMDLNPSMLALKVINISPDKKTYLKAARLSTDWVIPNQSALWCMWEDCEYCRPSNKKQR